MILYRTCKLDHTSYEGFKWNVIGEITEAPDWDPDPEINCGKGLHAVGNGLHGNYTNYENCIVQIIEVDEKDAVRSINKWRFKKAKTLREYVIDEYCNKVEIFKKMVEEGCWTIVYWASLNWHGITDEMKVDAFSKLNGEWLYWPGRYWKEITDEMRKDAFDRLEGKWLFNAGRDWEGITDKMRINAFDKLNDEWS